MTVLVIRTRTPDRASEALRAAIGLGLRGDDVRTVVLTSLADDPRIRRALDTLEALGRPALGETELVASIRAADRVEVWT